VSATHQTPQPPDKADRRHRLAAGFGVASSVAAGAALAATHRPGRTPRPDDEAMAPATDRPQLTDTTSRSPDPASPAARRPARWRGGWAALAISSLARAVLAVLGSLLLWSVLPSVLGWHTTVVMSGSMQTRVHPGDVVVSRPVDTDHLRLGQVLLVDDPDHPGRLRLHRLAAFRPDGTLILRGDANAANDSTPVARTAVHGVASLRVPYLGAPEYWLHTRDDAKLVLLAATLAGLLVAAFVYRCDHTTTDDDPADPADLTAPPATEAPADPAGTSAPGDEAPDPAHHAARLTIAGLLVATLSAATFVTADPVHAAGTFTGTATNSGDSWRAATYFTCANAAISDGARFAWPLSESTGPTATDISVNALNGSYSAAGVTYGTAGPCNGKTGVTLNGSSGTVSLSTLASNISDISFEIWFRANGSHGGSLMSITNGTATTMAMAMTTAGTLTLAISASGTKSVTTSSAFNNNQWHLAVGVIGAAGMALYVDNRAPITSTAVTSAATATGTPRVGYANHVSLGTGSFDYFQGSVAYAALYKISLSATQVGNHYSAT
jgi:signal peptidase I